MATAKPAVPAIPTLPEAPAPYTAPAAPTVNPFSANIDMNALIAQAASMLRPQYDVARGAEATRVAQQHTDIENDAIKRGWDKSIYTAGTQSKATTESNKNLANIDLSAQTAANQLAQGNYDTEYQRQRDAWQSSSDNQWKMYSAQVDEARNQWNNAYQQWQDTITNLWNTYNAQYAAYQTTKSTGGTGKKKTGYDKSLQDRYDNLHNEANNASNSSAQAKQTRAGAIASATPDNNIRTFINRMYGVT